MAIDIVDLLINRMMIFQFAMLVYQRGTPIKNPILFPIKLNNLYYNSIKSQKKSMKKPNFRHCAPWAPVSAGIRRSPEGFFRCWRNFCFSCLKMGLFVRMGDGPFAASQYDEWTIF